MREYKLCKFRLAIRFIVYHSICNTLSCLSEILKSDKLFLQMLKWHFKRREILELQKQVIDDWFMNAQTYRYLFKIYDNIKGLPVTEIKEYLLNIYPEIEFNKSFN